MINYRDCGSHTIKNNVLLVSRRALGGGFIRTNPIIYLSKIGQAWYDYDPESLWVGSCN